MHFNTKHKPYELGDKLEDSTIVKLNYIPRENNCHHIDLYYDIQCCCGKIFRRRKDVVDGRIKKNKKIVCLPCSRIQKFFQIETKIGHLMIKDIVYENDRHWYICQCECGKIIKKLKSDLHRDPFITKPRKFSCGCIANSQGYQQISGQYLGSLLRRNRKYKEEFNLTAEYLYELFEKQNGLCAYTKIPLIFKESVKDKKQTASLDRVDSLKGYIVGNVQWVHKRINTMKWNFTEKEFLELCKLVVKNIK